MESGIPAIRDSKNPTCPVLRFPATTWQELITDLSD
jgi:uncharacterized protein DUF397